jgi:hypothetical protein
MVGSTRTFGAGHSCSSGLSVQQSGSVRSFGLELGHFPVVAVLAGVRERGRQFDGAKEGERVECSSPSGTGEAVVTGLTAANHKPAV